MCLYISPNSKIEIVKEPIVCKKVIKQGTSQEWLSWIRNTKHEYNKELIAVDHLVINFSKGGLCNNIEKGFHAYLEDGRYQQTVQKIITRGSSDIFEVFAVIPPGAEYCTGEWDEIVANKIIVFSNEEELNRYVSSC